MIVFIAHSGAIMLLHCYDSPSGLVVVVKSPRLFPQPGRALNC